MIDFIKKLFIPKYKPMGHFRPCLADTYSNEAQSRGLGSKNENDMSTHDKKNAAREGQILAELLEISEQRELLQSMLNKDRARYQQEDMAIEEQMKASGLRIN